MPRQRRNNPLFPYGSERANQIACETLSKRRGAKQSVYCLVQSQSFVLYLIDCCHNSTYTDRLQLMRVLHIITCSYVYVMFICCFILWPLNVNSEWAGRNKLEWGTYISRFRKLNEIPNYRNEDEKKNDADRLNKLINAPFVSPFVLCFYSRRNARFVGIRRPNTQAQQQCQAL